ncbi:MAG: hypothetical protein ACE5Q6_21680 [Dehalococcoidia bacterium]
MKILLLVSLALFLVGCAVVAPAATPTPTATPAPTADLAVGASDGVAEEVAAGSRSQESTGESVQPSADAGTSTFQLESRTPPATQIPDSKPTPVSVLSPTPVPGVAELFAQRDYLLWVVAASTELEDATTAIRMLGQNPRPEDASWREALREQGMLMQATYGEALAVEPPGTFETVHSIYLEAMTEFASAGDHIVRFAESPQSAVDLNKAIELIGRANALIGKASLQLEAINRGQD